MYHNKTEINCLKHKILLHNIKNSIHTLHKSFHIYLKYYPVDAT